jgi:hypothetical protein
MDMATNFDLGEEPHADLFSSPDVPLKFVLVADYANLDRDRSQETEDRPAQVLVLGKDGDPTEITMQVRTRGNWRLQKRICPDPPLRLNFPETRPAGTVFDGQDKLKLVTHCRDTERYEQNLLEEFLAYRFYNQLTDIGFQVQLAEITYVDVRGERDPKTRMAFLIEDEDAMSERLGGKMIEAPTTRPDDYQLDQLSLMYVFQYLIGNVDWGTGSSHNAKILNKDFKYYPIPYDFDWSGFVYTPYSGPNELTADLHDNVRQRVYWGVCMPGIDYDGIQRTFDEKRDALFALVENQVGLSESNKESAAEYLEEFYEVIDDPARYDRRIKKSCRPYR